MKRLVLTLMLAFAAAPLAGCVYEPPPPYHGAVWVPGHYNAAGFWVRGHYT